MGAVYKYCDQRGIEILRNLELKITPPNQFNDPFEFTPHIVCSNLNRSVKKFIKDKGAMREVYEEAKIKGEFRGNFRDFRKRNAENKKQLFDLAKKAFPESFRRFQKNILNLVSNEFGVLCLSEQRDSILMWGHYCNKHQGIVIGFDSENAFFKGGAGLQPVKYVRDRVQIDEASLDMHTEWRKQGHKFIFAKNDEWKYEAELRQLFLLQPLKQKALENGSLGYFATLPPSAIQTVSLGVRISNEHQEEVKRILRQPCFNHVKLETAELHETRFSLNFH
jgi:hypothetical protein